MMSKNCPIMQRMKDNYEKRSQTSLTRRTPVIIRLDGKAFHTWTKREDLQVPFDKGFRDDMRDTAIYLCENIQGAKMSYTQSDEISILVTDYDTLNTQAWFDYNIQKIVSVSASYATSKFNELRMIRDLRNAVFQLMAQFDSRVFNIPKEEVSNYFLARERDAVKSSISSLAQSLYSHKELYKKSSDEMQEMCFQRGQNWNDLPYYFKRGTTIVKNTYINDELTLVWPEHCYKKEHDGLLEYYPEGCREDIKEDSCRRAKVNKDLGMLYFEDIGIEKIRTKWEAIETPMTFELNFFKDKQIV